MRALFLSIVSLVLFSQSHSTDMLRRCAIKRFQKSGKCYACGQSTNGIFNKAEKIIAKIEKRNEERRKAKEEDEVKKYGESGIVFGDEGGDGDGDEEQEQEQEQDE
jgi:RING finger protein 113A